MNAEGGALTTWARRLRWPLIVLACAAGAVLSWQLSFGFSASANEWLTSLAGAGAPPHGMFGRVLRRLAKLLGAGDLGAFAVWAQLFMAFAHLLLLTTIGRLLGLESRALLAPALLVATNSGRQVLATFGAESVVSMLTLGTCAATWHLARLPQLAGLVLGGLWFALAVSHPTASVALPAILVTCGMFPRPKSPRPATEAWAARPIWLPWLGAAALCGGLLLVTLPGDRIKAWWEAIIALLRATEAAPEAGGIGDLPVVGPVAIALLVLPAPALLLACAGCWNAWRRGAQQPAALLAALVAAWLVSGAVMGRPSAGPFSIGLAIAPALAVLAAETLDRWARAAAGAGPGGRAAAIALVIAALLSSAIDVREHPSDLRNAIAVAGLVDDPSADTPARIDSHDIAVLRAHSGTTAVLPSFRGGNPLARRLVKLRVLPEGNVHVRPFAASQLLLHVPAADPISAAWATDHPRIDCDATERSCLYRLAGKPAKPSGKPAKTP